jgi:hypothetical protein
MVRVECMPDVTNDERGRRIFQLHKERAVEKALEKIRLNPKSDWATFSQQDIKSLSTMLGETWVSVERSTWEQCSFSRLTRKDLNEIISIGNDVKSERMREETAVNTVSTILKKSI